MRKGGVLLLKLRSLNPCNNGVFSSSRDSSSVLHRSSVWTRSQLSSAAAAMDPDQSDERGPFSDKILRLRDEIAGLTDEELTLMSASLRKKLGLPDPPPIGSMPMGGMATEWQEAGLDAGTAAAEEKAPEKTSFSVKIEKFDAASKIKVIKEVRAASDFGLKEAKEFVEKLPAVLKSGLTKEEASQLIEKLKGVGATAVME